VSDARCDKCQKTLLVGEWPFCPHGFGHNSVQADEIPGGFVQENFGPTPEVFYSKKAMARRAKELGLMPFVRHIGENGTDKSSKTTRWV
jgi:hypothetical protein